MYNDENHDAAEVASDRRVKNGRDRSRGACRLKAAAGAAAAGLRASEAPTSQSRTDLALNRSGVISVRRAARRRRGVPDHIAADRPTRPQPQKTDLSWFYLVRTHNYRVIN